MEEQVMLSEHFSLREMTASATAIRMGIDNTPGRAETERMRKLCAHVLEPVRRRFGVTRITSGYRCERLNRAVGGANGSQHTKGEAADIHISNMEVGAKVFSFVVENLQFDQLLFEKKMPGGALWLHVSYTERRPNRRFCKMYVDV